ncbi:MAG: glutaredoxin family protein [Bacteroidota bacterium]
MPQTRTVGARGPPPVHRPLASPDFSLWGEWPIPPLRPPRTAMRILILCLIAVSGWIGLNQVRVQRNVEMAKMASDARIVMYSTEWCDLCDDARAVLDARGVDYVELDIQKDETALDAYATRGGTGAVPLLVIGGESMSGFNAEALDARLRAVGL